jgi:hypothetical protein
MLLMLIGVEETMTDGIHFEIELIIQVTFCPAMNLTCR